ncbi:hypothetical protein BS78_05G280200 [Paspalum vaginatum]|nr:hypothetical protein BS78_05G280200 [Paspalum vaginatum]
MLRAQSGAVPRPCEDAARDPKPEADARTSLPSVVALVYYPLLMHPRLVYDYSSPSQSWFIQKRRNRLLHKRMGDLVFVKFISNLRIKKVNNENKNKDPIGKEVEDVVDDEDNEFITGLAPVPNAIGEQQAQDGASQEREVHVYQDPDVQAKRKRQLHARKKFRSLQALMRNVPATSLSSESEYEDGDISMHYSDSGDD